MLSLRGLTSISYRPAIAIALSHYSTTSTRRATPLKMAPKRKLSDTEVDGVTSRRPQAPRRSSRRIKDMSDPASPNGVHGVNGVNGVNDGDARNHLETKDVYTTREVVERAKHDLSQMEKKLQSVVRTQRRAVEMSDIAVDESDLAEVTMTPEQMQPAKGLINERPKDQPSAVEQAPVDDHEAELAEGDIVSAKAEEDLQRVDRGIGRPPAVNSDQLPLPWKGRLGFACLNTYLRNATPPVFSSRTCRISSIIEHRHPLVDPSQPEHPTKNRPDKSKPADVKRGQEYVHRLGWANAKDIVKMLRWNEKYGIKFMRLSSEMFPFASHDEHGYKLEPFAAGVLAEAGKVAAELGHRLTTHPGQFTQIGSPRKEVVAAAIRDLEYHDEMLSLLKLPEQMDRDAIMILHMGGTYGDKEATLERFRNNYVKLSDGVKKRLVLENDDVSWTVHDLLPICEELNIPMVLDYHHHNILFDKSQIREGTLDIIKLYDRITRTWTRKRIKQKMHYSESTSSAVTPRERRKHSARVKTLPPCSPDMDLMIEAKDKEQAVFELMRTFKLPGWDRFNDVVPYERDDESRKAVMRKKDKKKKTAKAGKKGKKGQVEEDEEEGQNGEDDVEVPEKIVSEEDFGMGGPEARVYWPEGMEEWLRPKKREMNKKPKKEEDDE